MRPAMFLPICLLVINLFSALPANADAVSNSKLSIRLGRPLVVRGPEQNRIDNAFAEIQLPSGSRRGFTANGSSFSIDGQDPWSMGGPATQVLGPGVQGTFNECGNWIFGTLKQPDGVVRGFIHAEQSCPPTWPTPTTHKSFAYAESSDYGQTWTNPVQIIRAPDSVQPQLNHITGEGDCTVVDGHDTYYYAYCLRALDGHTIVARAPISNPGAGNWIKYLNGWSTSLGLGGDATALNNTDFAGAGYMTSLSQVALFSIDLGVGGLKMSLASDKVNFYPILEPLVPLDGNDWLRNDGHELYAYPTVMNYTTVNNQLQNTFLLTNMYLEPGYGLSGWSNRYLVFRDVAISVSSQTVTPQVGLALSRWVNSAKKDNWSTTAPVPGNFTTYTYDALLGYVMTEQPSKAWVKLEDCVINPTGDPGLWPGHIDHLLTNDGTCVGAGYTRLRTVGWIYYNQEPNTVPLYRCWNDTISQHFVSNQSNCGGYRLEYLLGYALAN